MLNAYVQPAVAGYLDDLERVARGQRPARRLPRHAVERRHGDRCRGAARGPISLVESGPAGGVIGAARVGEQIGEPNVIYLDIGGTTAKCSLIEDGEPKTTTEYRIEWSPTFAGYPLMVPVVDIVEIGAGGGSIAWIDDGGALRVGPQSAGADPGPACYGRGGLRADRHRREAARGRPRPRLLPGRAATGLSRARARRHGTAERAGSAWTRPSSRTGSSGSSTRT